MRKYRHGRDAYEQYQWQKRQGRHGPKAETVDYGRDPTPKGEDEWVARSIEAKEARAFRKGF